MMETPAIWLVVLFFLTFLGNGTLPLPITVYMLWMGQFDIPVQVVLIATVGTVSGWVFVGGSIHRLISGDVSTRITRKIPRFYHQLFLKNPGWAIFLWNSLPFPIDISRILALAYGIDPLRLVAPLTLGRIVRYSILVTLGGIMADYNWFFWVIIVLAVLPIVIKLFQKSEEAFSEGMSETDAA